MCVEALPTIHALRLVIRVGHFCEPLADYRDQFRLNHAVSKCVWLGLSA